MCDRSFLFSRRGCFLYISSCCGCLLSASHTITSGEMTQTYAASVLIENSSRGSSMLRSIALETSRRSILFLSASASAKAARYNSAKSLNWLAGICHALLGSGCPRALAQRAFRHPHAYTVQAEATPAGAQLSRGLLAGGNASGSPG